MNKKDYFIRSCIYNHVCVVGKKETVYKVVQELQMVLKEIAEEFKNSTVKISKDGLQDMRNEYLDLLEALLWMLDGAQYLW